jgi:GSH-dependent disulfide-bond oxidoreductase
MFDDDSGIAPLFNYGLSIGAKRANCARGQRKREDIEPHARLLLRSLACQRSPAPDIPIVPTQARTPKVIDLYTWTTPNGRKVSIALEELGLPYTVHPIDISKNDQFALDFLKIAPNNRIPAIVDLDTNIALMESGAILIYLADKTGKLMPKSGEARYRVIEWLMWQMGGPGPMLGQVHHFVKYNKGKAPYAEERYLKEGHRLYMVLNTRLEGREFVADQYSIADIAIWPWISRFEWQTIDLKQYPNVKRWYETIAARPAVQKGYKVPKDMGPVPMPA